MEEPDQQKSNVATPKIEKPVFLATALTVVSVFLGEFMPKSGQVLKFRSKEDYVATSMAT